MNQFVLALIFIVFADVQSPNVVWLSTQAQSQLQTHTSSKCLWLSIIQVQWDACHFESTIWRTALQLKWFKTLVMSASLCLKTLANWMFIQQLIQANTEANIKDPHYWPLWGESNGNLTGGFPLQRASNVEIISMAWRHHEWCNTSIRWSYSKKKVSCRVLLPFNRAAARVSPAPFWHSSEDKSQPWLQSGGTAQGEWKLAAGKTSGRQK